MNTVHDDFDILAELDRIDAEDKALLEQKIEEATRLGKEAFDINVLKQYYHPQGLMRSGVVDDHSEELIESYRRQYYLTYADVMSMREFISKLEQQDMFFE